MSINANAKIIADSISPAGKRLTTFELEYPRFIHSEFMTHRVFSKNSASSRAIPLEKMIKRVLDNPAMPIHWGENQKGMQASKELSIEMQVQAKAVWLEARDLAVQQARKFLELNIHKQIANRILEPFTHMNVIVTGTEYDNFFWLRCHKDAQPEIQELATQMSKLYFINTPNQVKLWDWHLPYIKDEERTQYDNESLRKFSAARCARVSYLTHDGQTTSPDKDMELFNRLASSDPKHLSPLEHQAMPLENGEMSIGNFTGWLQFRKLIPNENLKNFTRERLQ